MAPSLTALSTFLVKRRALEHNGDKVRFSFGGEFTDIGNKKNLFITINNDPGQILAAFEALTLSEAGYWKLDGTVMKSGDENLRCFADYKNHKMTSPWNSLICDYQTLGGINFTSDFNLVLSAQDDGGASGFIRLHAGWWEFLPAAV